MASSRQCDQTSYRLPDLLDVPFSFYEWTRSDWQRWAPDCIPDSLQSSHHDSMSSDPPCLQLDDELLWNTFMELDVDAAAPSTDTSMELDEDAAVLASGAFMELENIAAAEPASDHLQENHHMPPVGNQVAVNAGAGPTDQPQPQQQNLAPPPLVPSGAFMELENIAAAEPASDHLQENHHMPPVGTQVAVNAGAGPTDQPQPQQQNLAPPPLVPSGAFMELENIAAAEPASHHLQENHHMLPVGTQVAVNAGAGPSDQPQPQQQNLAPPPLVPPQNNNARDQQWEQEQHPMSFPEDGPLRNIADLLNCRPSFLLSKKLTSTDTNLSQCRLSVPKTAVRANFKWPLFSQEDIDKFDTKDGLELTAFDQNGEEYAMRFKLWKSCGTYILLGKWKEFLQNNNLQGNREAEVCIWATRHPQTGRIIFLMTVH